MARQLGRATAHDHGALRSSGVGLLFSDHLLLAVGFSKLRLLILQNDFGYLYFVYKAYLLDLLAHGQFPFWSPAEASGYSFFSNPFCAVLYPPNLLLLLVRLVVGNYNTWFHQLFTVLGVSWFALGLYRWLHRLFGQREAAAFAAMAISTCWMVSEFMRFPNAIHALAWLPWALSALYAVHRDGKLRHVYFGAAAILCQATAGYPYFVVYSFLFYAGYVLYLHWDSAWAEWKRRVLRQGLLLAIPVLITLPYTRAIAALMKVTSDRNGGDFSYATFYPYGPLDVVGSLVFPPVATIEGCFYCGSLGVFLVVLYFWQGRDPREKIALLLGVMFFLSMMFGFRSFLFETLWSVPVINQMRAFGRMAVMLLPLLAIMMHHGYTLFCEQLLKPVAERVLSRRVVFSVFGPILLVQGYLYIERASLNQIYASLTFGGLPQVSYEIDFLMYTLLTVAVVLGLLYIEFARLRNGTWLAFVGLIWIMAQDTGTQGRFLWTQPVQMVLDRMNVPPNKSVPRRAWVGAKMESDFYHLVQDYFTLDRSPDWGDLNWQHLTRGSVYNWDYDTYTQFLAEHGGDKASLARLLGVQKLFVHSALAKSPAQFLRDAEARREFATPPIVKQWNGSDLVVSTATSAPGYLAWMDNWDEGWSATLDGAPAPIERLMGTFKTVKLASPGQHTLSFRYRPRIAGSSYLACVLGVLLLVALPFWERRRRLPPAT